MDEIKGKILFFRDQQVTLNCNMADGRAYVN